MRKLLLLSALLLFATNAFADEYIETWDDPLGGWRDRWVAQNTNMQNYYVCTGNPDENFRGNNPCGLWICDGTADATCEIIFDAAFGASITEWELGIEGFVVSTLTLYDMANTAFYSTNIPATGGQNPYGCYTIPYVVPCPNGVSRFTITSGGQVEGNTAVDNMRVVTNGVVAIEKASWGAVKALYR